MTPEEFVELVKSTRYKPKWEFSAEVAGEEVIWVIGYPVDPIESIARGGIDWIDFTLHLDISKGSNFATYNECIGRIKTTIQWIELHELDEHLYIDGKQIRNPHALIGNVGVDIDEYDIRGHSTKATQ